MIATAAACVIGWLLITFAIAGVCRARVVWPLSLGLLVLLIPGIKPLALVAWDGLADRTRDIPDPQDSDHA